MNAVVVLVVLVILGACAYVIWGKTRATVTVTTNQNKDQLRDAVTNFLTHRKYITASQSENLMTYVMDKSASCLIGFLLLCLGLIPGILYLALGGSTKTLTIQFSPQQTGWNVRIQGQRSIVMRLKKTIAMTSMPMITTTTPTPIAAPAYSPMVAPSPIPAPLAAPTGPGVPMLDARVPSETAPIASDPRTCTSCGALISNGLEFCSSCGTKMA